MTDPTTVDDELNAKPTPVAGDSHNGFTVAAYDDVPGSPDYRVELRHGDRIVNEFRYPAYRIWTLLAHWSEDPVFGAECSTCGSADRDAISVCSNAWHVITRPQPEAEVSP